MTITVFLADDHAVVRDGLRFLLEAQPDIRVIGDANNGRKTVELVEQLCPDVVVMDIAMPELNGIEATQKICAACSDSQVIILSMYSTDEHILRALQAGARGYLLKESAGIEVVNAVRAVHMKHRYLSQKLSEKMIDDYCRVLESTRPQDPLALLSPREREVLVLVVEGKSSAEVAATLSLSIKTVNTYRSRLMHKLGISNLPGLVKFAIQHGLIQIE